MTHKLIKLFVGLILTLEFLSFKAYSQRRFEDLGRGTLAVQTSAGVFVSWRLLGTEWENTTYNIYRDGAKINTAPLTVSNFVDPAGTASSSYTVTALTDGQESQPSPATTPETKQYHEITLKQRNTQIWEINDGTAADLDGDGEYEIIIKRLVNDWSADATNFSYFEAYKMDGTLMWEINVGPNIMSSSGVEINIAAFDLDEDGKAEVFMRTSEGTVFGDGTEIGDTDGDGKTNYRYSVLQTANMQYMNEGPEFLSLIDGETGAELDRVDYIPRGKSSDWGDSYGHRASKYFFGAPYLDGVHPSLFIGRGIYTKTIMRTYDVVGKKLVFRWEFNSGNSGPYFGQGNHNYTIADTDGDGRDEIVWGSMIVDDNGKGLFSTNLGHGDALHVGDLDPYHKGTEVFKCLENSPVWGTVFFDGTTGEIFFHHLYTKDCGRCMAGNISDNITGCALWGGGKMFSAATRSEIGGSGGPENYRIYWDGDLLEEMTDHTGTYDSPGRINKYGVGDILVADGTLSCNYTKGTPVLQADLYGDWREEVIWRTADNTKIRIYTTVDPTPHRVYTLMHDHQYRQAICWQMCGYNQPPHTSFFLGEAEGKTIPPPPSISNDKLVYNGSGNWGANAAIWNKNGASVSSTDSEKILFDVSAGDDVSFSLTENVTPASLTVNSPGNYTLDATGGKLGGSMSLVKQGAGSFTLNGTHDYSGLTEVWQGKINFDGELTNSKVLLEFFGEMNANGSLKNGVVQRYGSMLSIAAEGEAGKLQIADTLKLESGAALLFDIAPAADQNSDTLIIDGDLELAENATLLVNWNPADPATEIDSGEFVLATLSGQLNGDLSKIKVNGLPGRLYELSHKGNSIVLEIKAMRQASTIVWNGDAQSNVWDLAKTNNFTIGTDDEIFVTGDNVVFNDNAAEKNVEIVEDIAPASVWVNSASDYTFSGSGKITGDALLKKSGSGKLSITNTNDFSGQVILSEGVLEVAALPNEQNAGSIGMNSTDPSKLLIDGGELKFNGEAHVNRAMAAGAGGATLNIGGKTYWHEKITGETLIKKGTGELLLGGSNTHKKTILQQGSLSMFNDASNPGQTVVIEGGILQFYSTNSYSTISSNFVCEEGSRGVVNMDYRGDYTGSLTGAGTLLINIPFVRTEFRGNWSAFEGTLKFASTNGGNIADVRLRNSFGWGKAAVYLGTNTIAYNLANTSFAFGELTGVGALTGNNPWVVGGRNTDARFDGNIDAGSLTKTGTGNFILPKDNKYTGGTTVEKGTLTLSNTSGSATGSGSVTVKSGGNLAGQGSMQGSLSVLTGGAVSPGVNNMGTLTINGSVTYADNAYYSVDVDPATNASDRLKVGGSVKLNGILYLTKTGTDSYRDGNSFQLFDANAITGDFALIIPSSPGENLKWDLSEMNSAGILKVALATGIEELTESNFKLYPNPVRDLLHIEISGLSNDFRFEINDVTGRKQLESEQSISGKTTLDLSALKSGVYILRIIGNDGMLVKTIVKQ